MSKRIVAVDGGGSKTDYLLADPDGNVLKNLSGAATSVTAGSLGQAAYNLREGLHQLLENETEVQLKALAIAVSGLDTTKDLEATRRVFGEVLSPWTIDQLILTNDTVAALRAGTKKRPAIVIISGTGANCVGWNDNGVTHRVSGLDYILADEGSGYDAGLMAIRAAVRAYDGRGPATQLQEAIFAHFSVKTAGELKDEVYSPAIAKDEVAAFATITRQLARDGDVVAGQIIDYCVSQLILDVRAVAGKIGCRERDYTLVPAGSFLLGIIDEFRTRLEETEPTAHLVIPTQTPVYGALAIAQEILAGHQEKEYQVLA